MRKLPALLLSLSLFPAIASAQSADPPPPPPDDAQEVPTARPPDAQPDVQPPEPPAATPAAPQGSNDDQIGILQGSGGHDAYPAQPTPAAPSQAGQWVYTSQYGWVWMPYGQQYVSEGAWGAATPYQYVYCVRLGWSWVAAPWLWGWGVYPWFGQLGPWHFGWYRGLYRAGYGWGHYRGGHPYGGYYRGAATRDGYVRGGGAYHGTRPVMRGTVNRAVPRTYPSARMQPPARTWGSAPARGGGSRIAVGGARGGAASHPGGGGFHGAHARH